MQNETNEVELSMKDLIINVIIKWRYIIIFSCTIAVVLLMQEVVAYKLVDQLEYNEEKLKYENDYEIYQTAINMNKNIIEYKLKDMNSQQEYNENSIKMKLDPLNLPVGVLKLYIKSDYMIMPEMTYQNVDISLRVVSVYYEYIKDGSFYRQLQEEMSEEIPLEYLKEIVEVTEDIDKRVISIKVNHKTEALCQEVIDNAWKILQEKIDEVADRIGTHELYKYDEAIYTDLDYLLKDFQQGKIQRVKDLNDELIVLYEEQKKLISQRTPEFIYDKNYLIKNGIKKVLIGLFIGFILSCMYYGVMGLISGKLNSISYFKEKFAINILGTLNKKRKSKIECWMLQKLGRIQSDLSEEDNLTLICSIIKRLVINQEKSQKESVLIIGSIIDDNYKEYIKKIQVCSSKLDIKFLDCMNFMRNAEMLKTISQYQQVLLLEQFNISKYAHVEEEINLIKKLNMNIIGAIIINV